MPQIKLAELADIDHTTLSKIERGLGEAKLNTLTNIANALGVTLDDLVRDSVDKEHNAFESEWNDLTKDCTPEERRILSDTVVALKEIMRRHKKNEA